VTTNPHSTPSAEVLRILKQKGAYNLEQIQRQAIEAERNRTRTLYQPPRSGEQRQRVSG